MDSSTDFQQQQRQESQPNQTSSNVGGGGRGGGVGTSIKINIDTQGEDSRSQNNFQRNLTNNLNREIDGNNAGRIQSVHQPEFSFYRAKYKTDQFRNIISHDKKLNLDGEELSRFILLQLSNPPCLFIKISGSHEERKYNFTTEKTETKKVIDFRFTIPVLNEKGLEESNRARKPYIVSDSEVVGRGGNRRESGRWENGRDLRLLEEFAEGSNQNANDINRREEFEWKSESVKFSKRRKADELFREIKKRGHVPFIPPWMFPKGKFSIEPERPPDSLLRPGWEDDASRLYNSLVDEGGYYIHKKNYSTRDPQTIKFKSELRSWCDEYCKSKNRLKEFKVEKVLYGWDLKYLKRELMMFLPRIPGIKSKKFKVEFQTSSSSVTIRPTNKISKVFSQSGFNRILVEITLVYPIMRLFRFLFYGSDFNVIRACYPLVYWDCSKPSPPLDSDTDQIQAETESIENYARQLGIPNGLSPSYELGNLDPVTSANCDRRRVLVGQSEKSWFDLNRGRISSACQSRIFGDLPP